MADTRGVTAPEATIRALIQDIFGALGFSANERVVLQETLLEASRAGYHSHGEVDGEDPVAVTAKCSL